MSDNGGSGLMDYFGCSASAGTPLHVLGRQRMVHAFALISTIFLIAAIASPSWVEGAVNS